MPFWPRMGPFEAVAARWMEAADTVPLSGPQQSMPRYESYVGNWVMAELRRRRIEVGGSLPEPPEGAIRHVEQ